ncbi:unnamed protein product [Camellia sinensis]
MIDHGFEFKDCNIGHDPSACDIPENYGFQMDDRYLEPGDLEYVKLIHGGRETCESFCDPNDDDDYDNGGFDFGLSDFDMPENAYEYEEVPLQPEKHDDGGVCFETNEHDDPSSQASLEDLCRSHLDCRN